MTLRNASREDLPAIVELLANDKLGQLREDYQEPLPNQYYLALDRILADPNQELMVLFNESNKVIGTLQLSFIQYLTYQGGIRAQIEAVRVHEDYRGKGLGQYLFECAIAMAKERNTHVIQLTTDKKRPDALKFYKRLGFKSSHEGMKLHL